MSPAELAETVAPALRMHEAYAAELTGDLSEAQMDTCAGPGHENTPRFTIGHLCTGAALTRRALEAPDDRMSGLDIPPQYESLFQRRGPQDRRTPGAMAGAPGRDAVLAELRRQHKALLATVRATSPEVLASPCAWKLGHLMPSHADLVIFAVSHEALHLGQLASWRRAMGLDAAMARMVAS